MWEVILAALQILVDETLIENRESVFLMWDSVSRYPDLSQLA